MNGSWHVLAVLAMMACGSPEAKREPERPPETTGVASTAQKADDPGAIRNVAHGCGHVYEQKPGAYTVVVVDGRVAWINDTLKELKAVPVGGGDVTTFELADMRGQIHDAIVIGTDLVVTDASADAVRRISLADGEQTTLVEGIRHPYELAHARGVYFIGGEDAFYRFDVATQELTKLHEGMAIFVKAKGDTVYVVLEERLLAIDARTGKQSVLVKSMRDVHGSPVEPTALAAIERSVVWSTADGGIWTYDVATQRSRKLATLAEPALQILPVGTDLYFAAGAGVQRLRAGRVETIPIDKRGWDEPDDPRSRIIAIGVHGDSLVYHAPFTAFASTCLR